MKKLMMAVLATTALTTTSMAQNSNFDYSVDRFADIEVLRYQVPGFEELSLQQKELVYYLTEAALNGRDILFDQNCKYNLMVRQTLEDIYRNYKGDKTDKDYLAFVKYLKQVWFGNGIHHHYSMDKFIPEFSQQFFDKQFAALPGAKQRVDEKKVLDRILFDPSFMAKRVNQADGEDLILTSACNMYEGVTQKEVEDFYNNLKDTTDLTPISWGLNCKVVKRNGKVEELPYKVGGLYSKAIEKIVYWLQKAATVAENEGQRAYINELIKFYQTGSLKTFDDYSIMWAEETQSDVDFINGFIESYGDPLGMTGSWEGMVNFKDKAASRRSKLISDNAQYFESNSPVDNRFKKKNVKGVSAKVITAAILAGDSYPSTPIGINLPNSNWIRAAHGSKSVSIDNITDAYNKVAAGTGFNEEFAYSNEEVELMKKYLDIADALHTDLHECLGHASGQLLPGVDQDALKAYGSSLEEGRADLFALYYLADPKLVELGIFPNMDTYKAEYYKYIMNGLMTQLTRIVPGKDIEEAHMRNRKFISEWCYQHGKKDNVIEYVKRDGKTYIRINDYQKLRDLFAQLLAEVQRIKSSGDYAAARQLVETYGVAINPTLHAEVLQRYRRLDLAPYKGFINPRSTPCRDESGQIISIHVDYSAASAQHSSRHSQHEWI